MSPSSDGSDIGRSDVRLLWEVRIPLRDGIELSATVYLPKKTTVPPPAIVSMTPYVADAAHDVAMDFAASGFTFVAVNVRSRGNSGGAFRPLLQEANDGYDVVEWVARQPYCNGRVAMSGASYGGYAQWATAKEFPPHLSTIIPIASPCVGVEYPMRNNIFYPYVAQWLTFTSGAASQAKIFADNAYWGSLFFEWHRSGRCFRDIAELCGDHSAVFLDWISHPEIDTYWDSYNPTAEQYSRLELPILTITGSYDDDQPGALEHYKKHMQHGTPAACARHFLVIGPWDHRGTGMPAQSFGGLTFGAASLVDVTQLRRQWYSWIMCDGSRPSFLKKRVAFFTAGIDSWRYADSLEEITVRHEGYFLGSAGSASDLFHSGTLTEAPSGSSSDAYIFDPRDVTGPELEVEAKASGGSLVDQSMMLALRGRQLIYHSAPLPEDLDVSGFFKLSAWISIDCPDTDFYVSIYEVTMEGSVVRLSTDAVRARYREGLRTPKLINTTEPLRYDFETFTFISRVLKRGHRLRLVLAPMGRLVETTFAEKNYNGGGVVAEETALEGRPVTVRLFHSKEFPSVLQVPVGSGAASASTEGALQQS